MMEQIFDLQSSIYLLIKRENYENPTRLVIMSNSKEKYLRLSMRQIFI